MTNPAVSFTHDIRPLFRESDRDSMERFFDIWDRDDVQANAPKILKRLTDGTMPCDEPWPTEQIDLFRRWLEAGCPA